MDESWIDEIETLKEQDWDLPDEPITDPYILLEAFNKFRATVKRRIGQAQDDLQVLEDTLGRHKADFAALPSARRDRKYEEKVLARDQDAIDKKYNEIEGMRKDQGDMEDRIFRLEEEIAEIQKKKKKEAQRQKRAIKDTQDEPEAKRVKDISPGRATKVLEMADKLKDVSTMAALRTLIDECASLARVEEHEESGEPSDDAPLVPDDLDLPDDDDVAGLSKLDAIATYSDDEKERLQTSK